MFPLGRERQNLCYSQIKSLLFVRYTIMRDMGVEPACGMGGRGRLQKWWLCGRGGCCKCPVGRKERCQWSSQLSGLLLLSVSPESSGFFGQWCGFGAPGQVLCTQELSAGHPLHCSTVDAWRRMLGVLSPQVYYNILHPFLMLHIRDADWGRTYGLNLGCTLWMHWWENLVQHKALPHFQIWIDT